jgi:hypothetical protein
MMRLFRHRRSRVSRLLDSPREGIEALRESISASGIPVPAIPVPSPADLLADLAARTGVDLADVAERLLARAGEAVARAGTEVELLAESDRARQLRDLAVRAAEQADLAYATSAARVIESLPQRRRRSHRGLILLSAVIGLAIGGGIAYFLVARPAERRPDELGGEPGAPGDPIGGESVSQSPAVRQSPGILAELGERITRARRAARATQSATERRLWREYRSGGSEENP